MKRILTATLIGLAIVAMSGCGREHVTGTGQAKMQVRKVAEFNGVNVSGSYAVIGAMGTPEKVVISTNENLLPYIESNVKDGVLIIENSKKADIEPTVKQDIWFFASSFKSIALNGSSKFQFFDMKSDKLDINLSGSHRLLLTGTATDMHLVVNGDSDVDAKKLLIDNATVEINGSGTVSLAPAKSLNVKINGSGKVTYFTKSPKIEKSVSGAGEVINGFGNFNDLSKPKS